MATTMELATKADFADMKDSLMAAMTTLADRFETRLSASHTNTANTIAELQARLAATDAKLEASKASTEANIARAMNELHINSTKMVVSYPAAKPISEQLKEIKETGQLPEAAYFRTFTRPGALRATAFLSFNTAADANTAKTTIKNARIPGVYASDYLTTVQHAYKVQVLLPMTKILRSSSTFGAMCDDYTVKVWRNGSDDEYGSARPPKKTINLNDIDASCLPKDIYDPRISGQLQRLFNWLPAPPAPAAPSAPSQQVPSASPTQGEEPTGNSTSDSDNDISMSDTQTRKRSPSTPSSTVKTQAEQRGSKRPTTIENITSSASTSAVATGSGQQNNNRQQATTGGDPPSQRSGGPPGGPGTGSMGGTRSAGSGPGIGRGSGAGSGSRDYAAAARTGATATRSSSSKGGGTGASA